MTTAFSELGLSEQCLAAVKSLGYTDPTPVQAKAIPAVLEGRDVIAAAKTGTGKTAAFSLPCMSGLGHARHGQGPLMLVVTPTRELAMQIEEVCRTIGKQTGHRVCCLVGGVSYDPQRSALRKGTDVLIATPGRLIDLMEQGDAHLNQVEALVLDEADRMLDMGFLPSMRKIVAACPEQRRTLLFSATIDANIEKNMGHLLHNPVYIEIAHKGETADTVDQYIIRVDQRSKADLLIALLKEKGGTKIIIFCRTRHRADNVSRKLRRAGFSADPIHGDRSQNQRKRALDGFAAGKVDILVATDVMARGIDVSDVNYVINFDLPHVPEDYVHRIGRTGRAGASGFAVSFVSPDTEVDLKAIRKLIGRDIPTMEIAGFDAGASEQALAAKATRKAAKNDPELADAAKEHTQQQARRKKRKASRDDAPHKTRGTAKKQGKKNQRGAATQGSAKQGAKQGAKQDGRRSTSGAKTGPDMRPGRAQRARREQQHSRG